MNIFMSLRLKNERFCALFQLPGRLSGLSILVVEIFCLLFLRKGKVSLF